jgi:zona occludens toxin
MSITLITGVPGSGKTLKAVWDHLRPEVGRVQVSEDEWGNEQKTPSTVYTNINSLKVDHELIEIGGTWTKTGSEWKYDGNPFSLRNWHNWAKPGAKIYADEFQKAWPPRPNGAPVPPDVQALDTHRHMGVDFVVITQNCRNVDRHLLGLVDRHLHVRRIANMPLAVIYEWDHASVNLNYRNSMAKSPWRYPRNAYKLYKSAELHTKQKRKMPAVVWFILFGVCGAVYGFPTLQSRLNERIHGKAPIEAKKEASANNVSVELGPAVKSPVVDQVNSAAAAPAAPAAIAPIAQPVQVSGCIVTAAKACKCFDVQGKSVELVPEMCPDATAKPGTDLSFVRETPRAMPHYDQTPTMISLGGTPRAPSTESTRGP